MGFVYGGWLILLGVLGAANLIIARKPDAKEIIVKLAPYQGWIGAVSVLCAIWQIIGTFLNLGLLSALPFMWVTFAATAVLQLVLGLLLGVGVLKTFTKSPEAHARMDETIRKVAPYQGTLGLVAIGTGVWMVVANVLFGA
jgi:hypothetical protein